MTRSIDADLLATQQKTAYLPSLQITFRDNNLPHPALVKTPLNNFSGNPTASVCTATSIVRAHRVAGVGLQIQTIYNPGVTSQWESWVTLDSNGNYPALFFTGSRVVLVYQDTSTMAVVFRKSDDNGLSWSSPTTIWTPAYYLNNTQFGISGTATRSAIVYANGNTLYIRLYNQSSNTFSAEQSITYGGVVTSAAGVHLSGDAFCLALNITDYASWTDSALVIQPLTHNGSSATWGAAIPYIGIQGGTGAAPAYAFGHVSLHKVGNWYYLTYTYAASAANGALYDNNDTMLAVSDDGTFYTAGLRLGHTIADRLQVHAWTDGKVYLCSDKHLFTSTPVATVTLGTESIKALDIQDYGPTAYAHITLDNRSGALDALPSGRLGCDVVMERGAICAGAARRCARETFVAARFSRLEEGATLEVRAYNYYRLLELWRAEFPYYYAAFSLRNLVTALAALAGIHHTTFDGSSIWDLPLGEFLVQPGQSAAAALASLQDQFQFVTRMGEGTTLQCLTLSSTPASVYVFGPGGHPTLRLEDESDRIAPDITHIEVIGRNAGAQAVASAIQFEMGRQFTHRITREVLTSNTDCATVAAATTAKVTTAVNRAQIVALPAFHLQPFDPITAPDGNVRYVTLLRETYNPSALAQLPRRVKQVYRQTLTLSAIVPSAGAPDSVNTIVPALFKKTDIRKGKLIAFDSTTWRATVWLDDTAGSIIVPVARNVHPASMVAGRRVAVLLFDATNPSDGLLIDAFSGADVYLPFYQLTARDGSPNPAWYCDNDGRLIGASGCALNVQDAALQISGTEVISSGRIVKAADGSAASPAYTFGSDLDSGLYRTGADRVGLAAAAALVLAVSGSVIDAYKNIVLQGDYALTTARKFSLADDTATSFTPPNSLGCMLVYCRNDNGAYGICMHRATSSPYCRALVGSATFQTGTGALTNGTGDGVDGKLNVHTHTDGKIYIKNRLGSTGEWGILFLGNY